MRSNKGSGSESESSPDNLCLHLCSMILFCFSISMPHTIVGQVVASNNVLLDSGINNALKKYWSTIGSSAQIYDGPQYKELLIHEYDTGHPYFFSDDWEAGSVRYDGILFTNVYIKYDITLDKLVIENKSGNSIEINKNKVSSFSVAKHDFVKLAGDSLSGATISTGFFDVLYDGDIKAYAKRTKSIQQKIESYQNKKIFKEKNRYYIYKDETYFPVSNKSSVLEVFSDRKAMLKKEISENNISFKGNREYAISQLARFYDESITER
jgi:hypothetical protein